MHATEGTKARPGILAGALAITAALPLGAASAARADQDVVFDGRHVSAFAEAAPVRDVMEAFARETGLRVRFVADRGDELVDVEIYELSIAEALDEVLAHRSYSRVGDQVWISSATRAPAPVVSAPSSDAVRTAAAIELTGAALTAATLAERQHAVADLAEAGTAEAGAGLGRVLDSNDDEQLRLQALRGLERRGSIDLDALTELASGDSELLRGHAIRLLSQRGDEKAQRVLEDLSRSDDALVRVTAMQALLRIAG